MELYNNVKLARAISPVSDTDDTAVVSQIVDRQGFDSCMLAILGGSIGDSDVTTVLLIEHGDASNLSDAAAVDDADLLGTEVGAAVKFDSDNTQRKIGYRGNKRYVRATITPTGNTSAALLAAVWILGDPRKAPLSTQAT